MYKDKVKKIHWYNFYPFAMEDCIFPTNGCQRTATYSKKIILAPFANIMRLIIDHLKYIENANFLQTDTLTQVFICCRDATKNNFVQLGRYGISHNIGHSSSVELIVISNSKCISEHS